MRRITSAVVLGAGVLVTTWVSAPAAPTAPAVRVSDAEIAEIEAMAPLAAEVQRETEQLRARLSSPPERSEPRRDPFAFASRRPTPRAPIVPAAPDMPAAVSPVYAAPELAWPTLAAVMIDGTADALARTAVVGWGDLVEFLKPGDLFKDFRVVAIGADVLDLRHEPTGALRTIKLR